MSLLTPYVAPIDWFEQSVKDIITNELDNWPISSNRATMLSPLGSRHSMKRKETRFIALDVMESEKDFHIHCEIPGVPKEQITLHVENNYLKIRAKKQDICKQTAIASGLSPEDLTFHQKEISCGTDTRFVHLPTNIDQDSVKCCFKDGALCITYVKKNTSEGMKKIHIQ